MAIEIVDFPIKNGGFPWQNVSSPEGKSFPSWEIWKIPGAKLLHEFIQVFHTNDLRALKQRSCCWNRGPFNIGMTKKQGGSKLIKEACSLDVIGYMCCFPYYLPKLSGRRLVKACDNRISAGLNTHVPAILMLTRVSKFLSVAMCL